VCWAGNDADKWIQTYDGGQSWTSRQFAGLYEANGIGFLDEQGGNRFAMVRPGQRSTMLLRDEVRARLVGLPESVRRVDAAVLDELVLRPMDEALGLASDSLADSGASGSPWAHNRSSGEEVARQVLDGDADLDNTERDLRE
ncbi:MAG: hypothetical protein ABGW82_11305, partial [Paracoccus sp. (in: a-proteobacteria)]